MCIRDRYSYCSDTSYSKDIIPLIEGSDLLYHESTFLEKHLQLAKKTKHSTAVQAAKIAKMSDSNGASALLCFPPQSMAMGGHLRPEMALEHFKRIADATDLPLICFNYPSAGNLTYPFDTLLKLFEIIYLISKNSII